MSKRKSFWPFAHIINLFRISRGGKKGSNTFQSNAGILMAFPWSWIDLWIYFAQECVTWTALCNTTDEERTLLQSWALENSQGQQFTPSLKAAFGNCQPSAQRWGRRGLRMPRCWYIICIYSRKNGGILEVWGVFWLKLRISGFFHARIWLILQSGERNIWSSPFSVAQFVVDSS